MTMAPPAMDVDRLSNRVIRVAIEVPRHLGPGLLESVYEKALQVELEGQGLSCERQVPVPLTCKGVHLGAEYRRNMLVGGALAGEIETVEAIAPIHEAPLLTSLRPTAHTVGLIISYNVPLLKDGIRRMVLAQ
jgi:GxxExxY protein